MQNLVLWWQAGLQRQSCGWIFSMRSNSRQLECHSLLVQLHATPPLPRGAMRAATPVGSGVMQAHHIVGAEPPGADSRVCYPKDLLQAFPSST